MAQEIGLHLTMEGVDAAAFLTPGQRADVRSTNALRLFPRLGREAGTRAAR
jgi:hypothetical protein